jgi:hypothetical protein
MDETIECPGCGEALSYQRFAAAGQGFMYGASTSVVMTWSSSDPVYRGIVGDVYPWLLSVDQEREVERAVRPGLEGEPFGFDNHPVCPCCGRLLPALFDPARGHFVVLNRRIDAQTDEVWRSGSPARSDPEGGSGSDVRAGGHGRVDLEEITALQQAYLNGEGPSLGDAYVALLERFRHGNRDRETCLRLMFLAWYSCSDPGLPVAYPDGPTEMVFQAAFEELGGPSSEDPEVMLTAGLMASIFPWCCGSGVEEWSAVGDQVQKRYGMLPTSRKLSESKFEGRGEYGDHLAHHRSANARQPQPARSSVKTLLEQEAENKAVEEAAAELGIELDSDGR